MKIIVWTWWPNWPLRFFFFFLMNSISLIWQDSLSLGLRKSSPPLPWTQPPPFFFTTLWMPTSKVEVRRRSQWHIDAYVYYVNNGDIWRLIGFYGHHKTSKREETWTLLESFNQSIHLPKLCIGDFNEITSTLKKSGGNGRPARQINKFRTIIHSCGFHDLGFIGALFTWFKKQLGDWGKT